jgi:hypothetical protein
MQVWARELFDEQLSTEELRRELQETLRLGSINYGVREAAEWAEDYRIPASMVAEDMAELAAFGGDFAAMVRARQLRLEPGRLNAARVEGLDDRNPEKAALRDLAAGIRVPTAASFVPNGLCEPQEELRTKYLQSRGAVDRMMIATRADGLAFVLPFEVARRVPGAHFSPAGWAPKAQKRSGRAVMDSSSNNNGLSQPLNSDAAALEAESIYGKIVHPTIDDIVRMILCMHARIMAEDGVSAEVARARMVLWKTDLRAAYTLLNFRPESAAHFMCRLAGALAIVFICGVFGWACTPHAFQVVTRALHYQLSIVLLGLALLYVDDAMGVCRARDLAHDMAAAKAQMRALLGPSACADDKDASGRALDDIGYRIDLDAWRVGVSLRNLHKAFYAFMMVSVHGDVTKPEMEVLASLGSRYCAVCRYMAPYNHALYASYKGIVSRRASYKLKPAARLAVRLWRVVLWGSLLRHGAFTRDLQSFAPVFKGLVVEFDASLQGLGFLFYLRGEDGSESCVGGGAVAITAMRFGDESAFQNTAEFIGAVVGLACALGMGRRGQSIVLRGDSVSALTWAVGRRFRSGLASNAAGAFTHIAAAGQLDALGTHLHARDNWRTDELSRRDHWGARGSVREVLDSWGEEWEAVPVIELESDPRIAELLVLCEPAARTEPSEGPLAAAAEERAFADRWARASRLARSLMHEEGASSSAAGARGV